MTTAQERITDYIASESIKAYSEYIKSIKHYYAGLLTYDELRKMQVKAETLLQTLDEVFTFAE